MTVSLALWSHALAALLFAALALWQARSARSEMPRVTLVLALGLTGLWALTVAGIGKRTEMAALAEGVRNLAWLGFMFALLRRGGPPRLGVASVYGVVALVTLGSVALDLASRAAGIAAASAAAIALLGLAFRMMAAIGALVLVHNLYSATAPQSRWGIRLAVGALAGLWGYDLALYTLGYLTASLSPDLLAVRGVAVTLLAPVLALAVHRNGDWTLQLSRTVAFQSLSLMAMALYLVVMVVVTSAIAAIGGEHARVAQTAFVFGTTAAVLAVVPSPRMRAWLKVKLAKHFFQHRYDYRAEWLRFTETLGSPGEGAAPLDERIVKAVADITDSPGGVLLLRDAAAMGLGASWNWERSGLPATLATEGLVRHLEATGRIVELEAVRADRSPSDDAASIPQWMIDEPRAWVIVPLVHLGTLAGAVLLARPPIDRALDWEDFDLLRIVGHQVASYLAEQRAQGALADAQRFDEFNRRFAFIMHDIKNLVSQLTLVARNAERHAENPAFRKDMVATLQDSAGRMNDLLARLSQHNTARADALRAVDIMPLLERVAAAKRAQHPIASQGVPVVAVADPARLEQVLGHLVQNAIEASPPTEPVLLSVAMQGDHVVIQVADRGCGMSPGFVRDRLFKPFVSSKAHGFGVGAFEARQLVVAMGGRIEVASREGAGSRFSVILPAAGALSTALEEAA